MPKKLIMILSFLVFCSLITIGYAQENANFPVAVLKEKVYKLENALEGTVVTHDFILQNTGTADLRIEQVKSG